MFKYSCIIKKNNPILVEKLNELGYKIAPKSFIENRKRGLLCRQKTCIGVPYDSFEFNLSDYLEKNKFIIDCGENEKLFISIASLRDDTDEFQWFVHKNGVDWWLCTDFDTFEEDYKTSNTNSNLSCKDFHKATVGELIEYFRN